MGTLCLSQVNREKMLSAHHTGNTTALSEYLFLRVNLRDKVNMIGLLLNVWVVMKDAMRLIIYPWNRMPSSPDVQCKTNLSIMEYSCLVLVSPWDNGFQLVTGSH